MAKTTTSMALSALSDEEFVNHLYRAILDRAADPGGLAGYLEKLETWSRGDLVREMRNSDEAAGRWNSSRTIVRSLLELLFLGKGDDLTDFVEYRLDTSGVEALWVGVERIATSRPKQLSAADIHLLFGDAAGWIDAPSGASVSGYVFGHGANAQVELRRNGQVIGLAPCSRPHEGLEAVGAPASRFTIRIAEFLLSDLAVNSFSASVDGKELMPKNRAFSPWLGRFMPTFHRLKLAQFEPFQGRAFRNGDDVATPAA